jgi:hypothetical protein
VKDLPRLADRPGRTTIDLFRSVSEAECRQIAESGKFQVAGGAEGKYFWERRVDAVRFGGVVNAPTIVRARYERRAASKFARWPILDGIGPARFADEDQMNSDLVEVRVL